MQHFMSAGVIHEVESYSTSPCLVIARYVQLINMVMSKIALHMTAIFKVFHQGFWGQTSCPAHQHCVEPPKNSMIQYVLNHMLLVFDTGIGNEQIDQPILEWHVILMLELLNCLWNLPFLHRCAPRCLQVWDIRGGFNVVSNTQHSWCGK